MGKKSLARKTMLRFILESIVFLHVLSQFIGLIGKPKKEGEGRGAKRQDWSGGRWNQNSQAVFKVRKKN